MLAGIPTCDGVPYAMCGATPPVRCSTRPRTRICSSYVGDQRLFAGSSRTAFLADRDVGVYPRYEHWWAKLPSAEARLLPSD